MINLQKYNQKDLTQVEEFIMSYFQVSKVSLTSMVRRRRLVDARFTMYYILSTHLKFSTTEIGFIMKRDHTSILHGLKKITRNGMEVEIDRLWYAYLKTVDSNVDKS